MRAERTIAWGGLLPCLVLAVSAVGCAVGKTATGGIVLGVEAGTMVETTNEALASLTEMVLPGLGAVLGGGGLLGGTVGVMRASMKELARKRADQARELAEKEALRLEVELARAGSNGS
jgi:hypothetical protein